MASLSVLDVAIVVLSLVLVFGVALYGSLKSRAQKNKAEEYFLAGRAMPWTIIAASLFASNIGAEHFVGQAGVAATDGMAISLYGFLLLLLGWVFAPVYLGAKLRTIPEYLERRFNHYCRILFVLLTLAAYVVTKIGATLYAGGVLLEVIAGMSIWESTPLIILATASYTITGGLTAVMYTDTIQTFIFLFGGLLGTGFALNLVGGLFGMFDTLSRDEIGLERLRHVLRPLNDRDVPWQGFSRQSQFQMSISRLGMLTGLPLVSLWYWCIDQEMTQRVLSAKSLPHATMGTTAAALVKIIPPFITGTSKSSSPKSVTGCTVVPGLAARTLFELCRLDETHDTFSEWCTTDLSVSREADKAYPLLVLREFPNGIRGIMVASFLAAMMSSLSSVYNSASTIFTYDIYERFFSKEVASSQQRLVNVGRVVTVVLTGFTFLWLPVVQQSSRGMYVLLPFEVGQEVMTHVVPAICAVFVCGLFVRVANGVGALSGMIAGVILGIARVIPFFLFQNYCDDQADEATRAQSFNGVNWLVCLNFNYFSLILFTVSMAIICGVSWWTELPSESQIQGLMSPLVVKRGIPERDEIQLARVQYNAMPETDSRDLAIPQNGEAQESGEEVVIEMKLKNSLQSQLRSWLSVEDGYAPHLLSFAVAVAISTLIAVFH